MNSNIGENRDFKSSGVLSFLDKITLNFKDKNIEDEFRKEYFRSSLIPFRISFITVIVMYSAFGYVDLISSKEFLNEFFLIRFFVVLPILLSVFILSFHTYFIKVWQLTLSISYLVGGTGIIYMLLRNPDNIFYYGGMFLIFIAGYFFIKLRFIHAIIPGTLLLLIYNIGAFLGHTILDLSYQYLFITNAFFISANIICMLALYNNEKLQRLHFYQRILLSKKQKEITEMNESLENQILERTHLLDDRNKRLKTEIKRSKEIEHKLTIAKNKAEESDHLKSAFLANMSHEIRTPMNGIIGFADLLKDPELTGEEQQKYLGVIERSGARMLNIITDLIDISTIEAGQMSLKDEVVNLKDELNKIYSFFVHDANMKGLQMNLKCPEIKQNFEFRTDLNKFQKIFKNLLKNSIKYTDEGVIEIGYTENENQIQFFVKDTGIGIPKDKQDIIFKRFVQADSSLSSAYEGAGLGLSITHSYVDMLGGNLWVQSEEGIGSQFYFTIPFKNQKHTEDLKEVSTKKGISMNELKEKTILIAEDQKSSDVYLTAIVKNLCKDIEHVQTGIGAIEACTHNKDIELILMDIKMPEMSGYEATKRIRKFNKDLIIIAQTAYALPGDREKSLAAGCNDYIAKPIHKDDLVKLISKYFPD